MLLTIKLKTMIYKETTIVQNITNKAHAKKDFTTYLTNTTSRYIVSMKNIFIGENFANCNDLILRVSKIVESDYYDSIGGWNYRGVYFLDANLHFDSLRVAFQVARRNKQISIYDTQKNITIYLNK